MTRWRRRGGPRNETESIEGGRTRPVRLDRGRRRLDLRRLPSGTPRGRSPPLEGRLRALPGRIPIRQAGLRPTSVGGFRISRDGVEQAPAVRAGTHRLSPSDDGAELGRDTHATAAAGPAHKGNDGRAPSCAAEVVVRGEESPRDGFPEHRAAAFEVACHPILQRARSRQAVIDFGKFRQRPHGPLDRHRLATPDAGSSRRSSAETASKMARASGASRMDLTASPSANICETFSSQGR